MIPTRTAALLVLGLVSVAPANGGEADACDAFARWFERYRGGRVDLYCPTLAGVARAGPTRSGETVYFKSDNLEVARSLLDQLAARGDRRAAELLLDAAVYRAAKDPAKERADCVARQPWIVRRLAASALSRVRQADARRWLAGTALEDPSAVDGAARRAAAATALGDHPNAVELEALARRLDDRDVDVRAAAAESIGAAAAGTVVAPPDPAIRANALVHLDRALKDAAVDVRIEALLGFGAAAAVARAADPTSDPAASEVLAAARAAAEHGLSDPHWSVRVTAADQLAGERGPAITASIPALVDALVRESPKSKGASRRVRASLKRTLSILTGEDFPGWRPEDWTQWWDKVGATFAPPAAPGVPSPDQGPRFFDVPIEGDVVLFLLDASGSMRRPSGRDARDPERLFLARRELERCLASLPPGTRFNVVVFAETARAFASEPVAIDPGILEQAKKFLATLKPDGGTNLSAALDGALRLADPAGRDPVRDQSVDTIVLLTDGVPSRGPVLDPEQILHEVTRQNRRLRIALHTVSAGGATDEFLADLARANSGESRTLRK